jgi:hypothetical protein
MTEEERRKLCKRLRRLDLERDVGIKAADEIERLAEELKQAKQDALIWQEVASREMERIR